jgi:nucleoside-diphosphate-sugar epimerase
MFLPNSNVLLTGYSGFLGRHLLISLRSQNKEITLLDKKYTNQELKFIQCDLAKEIPKFNNYNFDIVIHAAGKAHVVPKTNKEKEDFYNVNFHGTKRLIAGLEKMNTLPGAFIFISTVSVYGRDEGIEIDEEHPLMAYDPYGKSKILAEQYILDWGKRNSIKIGILRLPLIVGKNPPGNLGSMIRGIQKGYYFGIGKSTAKKSMVLANDIGLILDIVADKGGVYNLTDGYHPSFAELERIIATRYGSRIPFRIPLFIAKTIAITGSFLEKILRISMPINIHKLNKITDTLTFSDKKARLKLGWKPKHVIENIEI